PVFHQLITSGYITEVRLSDWILLLVTPFIVGLMLNHYIQMYSVLILIVVVYFYIKHKQNQKVVKIN
ncbi:MAG: putative membrane protein, partial [Candidatus Paceibacteria bacterium]